MRARFALRAGAALVGAGLPLLLAAPALALDDGEVPGKSLGVGTTVLIYVLIPLGLFLVISAMVVLPGMLSRPRYRPGRPWRYDPLWFAGPDDPDEVISRGPATSTAKGGASAEW